MSSLAIDEIPRAELSPVLCAEDLVVKLPTDRGEITPVDGVSFDVQAGETLGLVGESGCGKSTLGRAVARLTATSSGAVKFAGRDIAGLRGAELRALRRDLQIVFQDPRGALDPRMTVGEIVGEPLRAHKLAKSAQERRALTVDMLEKVGLQAGQADRRPAELSGGQQQRVSIARALITHPRMVILDEPVSALDVSVQAQVVNLLQDLQQEFGVAYLFIAHNLAVVRHMSRRVMVMYLGQVVEQASSDMLFSTPRHPYTMGLIASVLRPEVGAAEQLEAVQRLAPGDVPSVLTPPTGCRYHTRCPFAQDRCRTERPLLEISSDASSAMPHVVACHFWREIASGEVALPVGLSDDSPSQELGGK